MFVDALTQQQTMHLRLPVRLWCRNAAHMPFGFAGERLKKGARAGAKSGRNRVLSIPRLEKVTIFVGVGRLTGSCNHLCQRESMCRLLTHPLCTCVSSYAAPRGCWTAARAACFGPRHTLIHTERLCQLKAASL